MGKIADPLLKLRCVHCGNTETPLWRAGPDGPKTLCNACGVRYKKGKLTIFRDKDGNLTAVKQEDTLPVHVPPAPKKSNKKLQQHHAPDPPSKSDHSHPSSPSEPAVRRPVRKVPAEGLYTAALAKKPRSRSRRTNAGQLPGRYSSKSLPDDVAQWHSPLTSPKSFSSSPAQSPRNDGGVCFQLARGASALRIDDPLPYQCDPSDEALFPDVSCLGIDSGDDDRTTVKLLPMDADPSSAEQFSFAFGELGNNASVNIGLPDRVKALRGLVLDRTRKVSARYESTVVGLCRLCEERCIRSRTNGNGQPWTLEDCKNYVRWFSQEQTVGFVANKNSSCNPGSSLGDSDEMDITAGFMLPEKTAYTSAVENLKALMDSSELAGFAEACMIELLCEDVAAALSKGVFAGKCAGVHFRLAQSSFPSNSISVRG